MQRFHKIQLTSFRGIIPLIITPTMLCSLSTALKDSPSIREWVQYSSSSVQVSFSEVMRPTAALRGSSMKNVLKKY